MRWLARPGTCAAAKAIAAYIEFSPSRSVILLFMVISGEGCLGYLPLAHRPQKEGDKEQPEQLVMAAANCLPLSAKSAASDNDPEE
jgi:hypothetical protein